jgi:hypothetical protein
MKFIGNEEQITTKLAFTNIIYRKKKFKLHFLLSYILYNLLQSPTVFIIGFHYERTVSFPFPKLILF